jgi:hypothetical protein
VYERVEEIVSLSAFLASRGQTFGAERFEKLLPEKPSAARRLLARQQAARFAG